MRDPKTANWMMAIVIVTVNESESESETGDDDANANRSENAIESAIWSEKWIEIAPWIGFWA